MKSFSQRWREASDEAKDQPMEEPNDPKEAPIAITEAEAGTFDGEITAEQWEASSLAWQKNHEEALAALAAQTERADAAQAKCAELEMWERLPMYLIEHYEGETLTEELIQQATAELLAPTQQASAWRPIDEDARNAEQVIGYHPEWVNEEFNPGGVRSCVYDGETWHSASWVDDDFDILDHSTGEPTHWQPLPAPPEEKRQ